MSDDREVRIRTHAYRIWQELGCPEGHAVEHWLEAERQLYPEEDSRSSEDGAISDEPAPRKSERKGHLAARRHGAAEAASDSTAR